MPLIKSAKKRARQALVRRDRNYNTRTALRKAIRGVKDAVKEGGDTKQALSTAFKLIDMAKKKNILKINTANRRKSLLSRMVEQGASAKPETTAAASKKAPAKKKAAAKKA